MFLCCIVVHILCKNIHHLIHMEGETLKRVYWSGQVVTYICYVALISHTFTVIDRKVKSRISLAMRLTTFDWLMFGFYDLLDEITLNAQTVSVIEWLMFVVVVLYNLGLIVHWRKKEMIH